jgi:DNA-binding CsgD family transcriptional regulator
MQPRGERHPVPVSTVVRSGPQDGSGERLLGYFAPPATGAVVGVAGAGKTSLLDHVAARLTGRGVAVVRIAGTRESIDVPYGALRSVGASHAIADPADAAAWLLAELATPPWLLVADDAHLLDDLTLAALTRMTRRGRPLAGGLLVAYRPVAGRAALDALATGLSAEKRPYLLRPWAASRVAALPAVGGDAERAARLVYATGGNPRLTVICARSDDPVPAAVITLVRDELGGLPEATRRLAHNLATAPPGTAADAAPGEAEAVGGLAALVAAGLVEPGGAVVPLVRAALAVVAGDPDPTPSPGANVRPDAVDAERLWADGDEVAAIAAADRLLSVGNDVECRASAVAAAGAAADGELRDAADRWRRIAAIRGGTPGASASGRAALAAAVAGDVTAARADLADARRLLVEPAPRGLTVLIDGIEASLAALQGRFDPAARRLAALAATTVPRDPLAPEGWVELAGTVAAAGGDDETARAMLRADRGRPPTSRGLLLTAWLDLRAGRLDEARRGLAAVGDAPILRRNAVLAAAIAVGLARRAHAEDGLAATWHRVAAIVAGADAEPLLLDVWGELSIGAAMVSPADRDGITDAMTAAVIRAGSPAWCAAIDEWWRLERAAVVGDEAGACAAAERLSAMRPDCRIEQLAGPARVWAAVLAADVDPPRVARAAAQLADAGRPWAAAALCSAAAERVSEPAAARRLLGSGRRLGRRVPAGRRSSEGLTVREREVGGLLLDGLTHKEIGARLFISPRTVEEHVARLRQKLAASSRGQLVSALRARLTLPADGR